MLDSCPLDSAVSEISLIRVQLRRVLKAPPTKRSGRPSRPQVGIGRSRGHWAAGPTSRRQSKHPNPKSLQRHLAMLITFNTTGIVLASLVRYHRYSLHAGLFTDPALEAFACNDLSDV